MPTYTGSCHCGAIQFEFNSHKIDSGLRCDCSICNKKGAVMTDFTIPPSGITITAEPGVVSSYQFASKVAKHYFCRICGIFPYLTTRLTPGEYRINIGCIDGLDQAKLKIDKYDGKSI